MRADAPAKFSHIVAPFPLPGLKLRKTHSTATAPIASMVSQNSVRALCPMLSRASLRIHGAEESIATSRLVLVTWSLGRVMCLLVLSIRVNGFWNFAYASV